MKTEEPPLRGQVSETEAEVPNVLGSKLKNLDLLEDQRAEIERIVRKQKRANVHVERDREKHGQRLKAELLEQTYNP